VISGVDLALVKLDRPVTEETIGLERTQPPVGARLRMLGWGAVCTSEGCGFPRQLQEVRLPVAPPIDCGGGLGMLCTIGDDGRGVSAGDSGGPGVVRTPDGRWRLAGVAHATVLQ
jgi:hypothetical protein